MATLGWATEQTFRAQVLAAQRPTLVLFGSVGCAASAALASELAPMSAAHGTAITAVQVDVELASDLAELYGVEATPTLLVFVYGEPCTRIVGFVPRGLLAVLVAQVAQRALPRDPYWNPLETLVEDTLILPLLKEAGLHYQRQVTCALEAGDPRVRGRIDLLVSLGPEDAAFTLIESKRRLLARQDLQRATAQALGYARALGLASFAVAAPAGIWLFRRIETRALPLDTLSSLLIAQQPERAITALRALAHEAG